MAGSAPSRGLTAIVGSILIVLAGACGGTPTSRITVPSPPTSSSATAEPEATINLSPTIPPAATPSTDATTISSRRGLRPLADRYPGSVPSNRCNEAAIAADIKVEIDLNHLNSGFYCVGPFGYFSDCSSPECETVWVFRWTEAGWTVRPTGNMFCDESFDAVGVPPANSRSTFYPCGSRSFITLRPEPLSGTITLGDEGERVRRLQQALIHHGLLADVADGQYGPNTAAAVIDLKFLVGLAVTDANRQGAIGNDPEATKVVFEILGIES